MLPGMSRHTTFVDFENFPHSLSKLFLSSSFQSRPSQVTIVPRGGGALGFAQYLPQEIFLRSKEQILVCANKPPVHVIEISMYEGLAVLRDLISFNFNLMSSTAISSTFRTGFALHLQGEPQSKLILGRSLLEQVMI